VTSARIKPGEVTVLDSANELVRANPRRSTRSSSDDKRGYEHFMLKEIHEQPQTSRAATRAASNHQMATAKLAATRTRRSTAGAKRSESISSVAELRTTAALVGALALENVAHPLAYAVGVGVDHINPSSYRKTISSA
jgi:glucosamine 6-phosphate synthetase-like amidotransferase/phosphosugar isomerase protein